MGYRFNCPDGPALMAVPKPILTEFGIHQRLESCALHKAIVMFDEPTFSISEVTDAKMMINVLMGQDVAGDSGSLRDVGNAVLLVNVQPVKCAG